MKRISFILVLFIYSFLFTACNRNDVNVDPIPTSVSISLNKTTVIADGIDEITVTVKDQDGKDISASSLIYVNGVAIKGNAVFFEANQQGTHKIFANKYNVLSDTLTVTTTAPAAAKYTAKVLAEYYTATWCGWCPRVDYKLNNFAIANNKLYTVQLHSNDALANREVDSTMRADFGVSSVPNILINRTSLMQENGDISNLDDSTELRNFYQKRAVVGLALNTSISGNNLNITTKTGFDATIKDSLKLVVLVVENNKVLAQLNYYNNNINYPGNPFFTLGDTITNYIHNGVYKASPTTIKGITVPVANQIKDTEYTNNFTVDITGLNSANLQVIAFLNYAPEQARKGILNVQWVNAGLNKNYD